ncbi:MAG TPA: histone deacetylase, partial [Thermoanaerobaculia bacterium]|nr:histone deacetylase [Thermoanaerobaculia bacterium]
GQTLRIHGDPGRRELVVELRVRRDRRTMPGAELLWIEWLLLQNPRLGFLSGRPPLPGQKAPGLGMLREVISLLILVCERIGLDGIAFVPSHFHLAVQAHGPLRFAEPLAEARYRALVAALRSLPLGRASEAVDADQVVDAASGEPVRWERSSMVLPVTEALKDRLAGEEFRREVERLEAMLRYRLAEGAEAGGAGAG